MIFFLLNRARFIHYCFQSCKICNKIDIYPYLLFMIYQACESLIQRIAAFEKSKKSENREMSVLLIVLARYLAT
jgi:hypothetical protein